MRGCVPWKGTTDATARLTMSQRRCARLGGSLARPLRITRLTYVELTRVLSSQESGRFHRHALQASFHKTRFVISENDLG